MNGKGSFDLIAGMKIFTSPHAVRRVPNRTHDKRRHRVSYHCRIQKKWNKRFGMREEPIFLVIDTRAAGLSFHGEKLVVAHPEFMAAIKASGVGR